jgi:tRNA 2-thiouridine synthesizing protein A
MQQVDLEVDARGLNCPLPILRARKGINSLNTGQVLKIIATDPGSVKDLEAFCKQTGNQMLESSQQNGEYHFRLRKG